MRWLRIALLPPLVLGCTVSLEAQSRLRCGPPVVLPSFDAGRPLLPPSLRGLGPGAAVPAFGGCPVASFGFEAGPDPRQSVEGRRLHPGIAFLASALVPGLGQHLQGQERWAAYAAAEVWSWIQYLDRRREGRRLRGEYRDLAWLAARGMGGGPRVDGSFEYYETLSHYASSGAFDTDAQTPGVQPETDTETYNGMIWDLAREIFLPEDSPVPTDPGSQAYARALDYYESRAYSPTFAWDWGSNTLQRSEYRDLIRASDENLRRSTIMIGVILANHLLSAVDGLISGRLGASSPLEGDLALLIVPAPLDPEGVAFAVRITLPRVP